MQEKMISPSPVETFEIGKMIGASLAGGEVILLSGGLGAGKTLLTKGILDALGFDEDEVTSPSFTLVNLYRTRKFDVYHIDLWRLEAGSDIRLAVGLDDIFENESAVVIVEWADHLGNDELPRRIIRVNIDGDGDMPREITLTGNWPDEP